MAGDIPSKKGPWDISVNHALSVLVSVALWGSVVSEVIVGCDFEHFHEGAPDILGLWWSFEGTQEVPEIPDSYVPE